jgi:S-formylglutathione hydrolase FrmB
MHSVYAILLLTQMAADPSQGSVRPDTLWSQSLGARKEFVVYLPPSYGSEPARRYPVVYYLHGLTGNQWDWVRNGSLDGTMDSLVESGAPEMIIVMPDGDDGWFTTWNTLGSYADCKRRPPEREAAESYCVPWPHYDEYIARDLVAYVDSTYRTIADGAHRGIAGLSMGGYGAISIALRYPEVFAAAASHSGVLSPMYAGPEPFAAPPRYFRDMDSLREATGRFWPVLRPVFGADTIGWIARDPARMAALLVKRRVPRPALYFDVGTSDQFVNENRAFDFELTALGFAHTYREWPGDHRWSYWTSHAAESLHWLGEELSGGSSSPP